MNSFVRNALPLVAAFAVGAVGVGAYSSLTGSHPDSSSPAEPKRPLPLVRTDAAPPAQAPQRFAEADVPAAAVPANVPAPKQAPMPNADIRKLSAAAASVNPKTRTSAISDLGNAPRAQAIP